MTRWAAILGAVLVAGAANADGVTWNASVPLWKSLSANGQLLDAGPAPRWASPPPAATLGRLPIPPRPAPVGTPRPQELPETLTGESGPSLPPPAPTEKRESFASVFIPRADKPAGPRTARLAQPRP